MKNPGKLAQRSIKTVSHLLTTKSCCNIWLAFAVLECFSQFLTGWGKALCSRLKNVLAAVLLFNGNRHNGESTHPRFRFYCFDEHTVFHIFPWLFPALWERMKQSIHDVWIRWRKSCSIDPVMWLHTHTHTLPYTNAFCCLDNRSAETTFESGCEVHYVSVITIICSIHSNNMPLNVWCGCFSSSVFLPWYKKAIFAAEHEQFVTFSHQPVQPITFLSWQVISWHSKLLESPCCISWMTTFSLRKIICLRWAVKIRSIQDRETCYDCWFTPCMAFHAAYFLA